MNLAAAYSALAQCYRYGAGVTEDKAAAVEMYKQAFALGQGLAADEIGTMYLVGNEILPNVAEAFRWYEKGAEMEEAASWYHLGICYAEGLGTEINRDKALEYLFTGRMPQSIPVRWNISRIICRSGCSKETALLRRSGFIMAERRR